MSVSKSEVVWVVIRAFGVFFAYQALVLLVDVASTYGLYRTDSTVAWGTEADGVAFHELGIVIRSAVYFLMYAAFSLYFLKGGKLVHRLLMNGSGGTET